MVLPRGRRGTLPHRGHLVADRDGGVLIAPYPGATALKPGSATRPCFGVEPCLVDDKGNELDGATSGALCIKRSWPGQMRTVYGDHQRFIDTYFKTLPRQVFHRRRGAPRRGRLLLDHRARGRRDQRLRAPHGHRRVESALVLHDAVAEAAVVGFPHDIKGQGIYAYVTLMQEAERPRNCAGNWRCTCARRSAIASPDEIQWAPGLPKTRSGKIMRRILRKIAANELDNLGDTSTLADPAVVDDLIENRATGNAIQGGSE